MSEHRRTEIEATPGGYEITIRREFDASREQVFRAYTEPELMAQWLGPRRLTMNVEEVNLEPGGRWRFVNVDEDGSEYGFHGYYHTVEAPERLANTFEYEGTPGQVSFDTVTLEEKDGKTLLTAVAVHQSTAARDAMIESGMERGVVEGYEKLDELLERQMV